VREKNKCLRSAAQKDQRLSLLLSKSFPSFLALFYALFPKEQKACEWENLRPIIYTQMRQTRLGTLQVNHREAEAELHVV